VNHQPFELPLFPLSAHILPKGKLQLRIFEARYIRMVKESFKSNLGFGICMASNKLNAEANKQILPIGTQVKIIDFSTLSDGLLGVTVEGISKFKILESWQEHDQLNVGSVQLIDDWDKDEEEFSGIDSQQMVDGLKTLFNEYPEIGKLYMDPEFTCINWVVNRWLEVIPLDVNTKQRLIAEQDIFPAIETLNALLGKPRG
jgi:Lon protease-like protein